MPHELERVIAAFATRPWAIHEERGQEIAAALMLRHSHGPRSEPFREEPAQQADAVEQQGRVAVMNLFGSIVPRASAVRDVSAAFASLERFQAAFREVKDDRGVSAIVLNIDSPGGMVDLVPETAALIRGARRADRPIYAVANTIAASAAYWIGSAADQFFASPSAIVGSIGVRMMHVDQSGLLKMRGLKVTHISAGARKSEALEGPLTKEALRALREEIGATYSMFVADVASARGVAESVVRADPEAGGAHMGGGRAYHAEKALSLGMIDEIATLDEVLARATTGGRKPRSIRAERERLSLL